MGEIYFSLFLFVVSIAGFINTLSWRMIKDASGGPATYPRIILIAFLACSPIRIIQISKQRREERPDFIFMDPFKGHRGSLLLALAVHVVSPNILRFMIATITYLNVVVNVMIYLSRGSSKVDKWLFIRRICLVTAACEMTWFSQSAFRVMVPAGMFGIQK